MKKFRSGVWAALACLAVTIPAAAQEPQAPSIFGEQIDVRVVNVEAVVTDRQGNRVQGLRPEDFRLKVDGKTVPVEFFNEVRGGQAIALGEGGGDSAVKGLPSLAPGSPVGTSYLVFVDNFFALGPRRDVVLRSLKEQLSRLGPEDRMAIVSYDGGGVQMLSSWSNSSQQLGRAIEQAIGQPAKGLNRRAELQSFESLRRLGGEPVSRGARSSFAQRLDVEEEEFVYFVASQVERAVTAATSTLRGFASPPGRKVMLLLSGGWPFSPTDYVINNPNRPVLARDLPSGDEMFRPLVDTANRLGYTIYTVDVPGVEASVVDASRQGPSLGGINIREQENQAALQFIAAQTGGEALLNARSEAALQTAEADTRSYYWLGFTPSWQGNDKRHKVEVEVTRPGLRIRSRSNFLDLSRKVETAMMVESAMMFGGAPDQASLPMKVGQVVLSGRREMEVPISLAIPAEAVTLVPLNGKQVAEVELRVAAMDVRGGRAPMPVIPVTLSADEAPKAGTFIRYDTKIKLRRMPHTLTVAIFDPLSGKLLTAKADVAPPVK
ncbi:MAG TPA: VWA domain-containing protein [Thermoanaerobaculia bacterium]|nr:VWA domain-containing protein [Thermoanaerobaculia bacterium]